MSKPPSLYQIGKQRRLAKQQTEQLTPIQNAVNQRVQRGRAPLDHWDMFANVMATRNQLSRTNPSYMDTHDITEKTIEEVHKATGLPKPDSFKMVPEHNVSNASTGGGYQQGTTDPKDKSPTDIEVAHPYVRNALQAVHREENTSPFRKFIRTISHEMTHVRQRNELDTMQITTRSMRELEAHKNELLQHPTLPQLHGQELDESIEKFNKYLGEVRTEKKDRKFLKDLEKNIKQRKKSGKFVGM